MGKSLIAAATAVSALLAGPAVAETTDEKAVLFEDTYLDSGYTSIGFKSSEVAGEPAGFGALAFGWRLDDVFAVGFKADGLASSVRASEESASDLDFYLLGAFGEATIYSRDLFALLGCLTFGWGEIGTRKGVETEPALGQQGNADSVYVKDSMTWAEPELAALVHVSHRIDFGLSAGYRATRGVNFEELGDGDLRAGTVGLVMRGNF